MQAITSSVDYMLLEESIAFLNDEGAVQFQPEVKEVEEKTKPEDEGMISEFKQMF